MRSITKSKFAKERGVSRTRVYQWIEDGRIVPLADGSIDADDAHARLGAMLDQVKGMRRNGNVTSVGPAPAANGKDLADMAGDKRPDADPNGGTRDSSDYWESKARREKAEAQRSEMKAMQEAGALVSAVGVRKAAVETARQVRNALLAIPDRIAPVLDPASPARAHKLLTEELHKVICELTTGMDERAAEAAADHEPEAALV